MNDLSGLWEPLSKANNEIRLLLLKPSAAEDALLKGRLENKSLNQPLHFDAISYAWGGAQASLPLVLETGDGSVEIPLTEHVGSALRSLRQSTATIALWIDAVCISQRDRSEREQQIGMLHHIFHRAAEVHVWIGRQSMEPFDILSVRPQPLITSSSKFREKEADRVPLESQPTPSFRARLAEITKQRRPEGEQSGERTEQQRNEGQTWTSENEKRRRDLGGIGHPLALSALRPQVKSTSGFDELMLASHSVYWDRLWIVGEIVLARNLVLHYGRNSIDVRFLMQQIEQNKSMSDWSLPSFLKDLLDLRTVLPRRLVCRRMKRLASF